ncbi:MAG: hypothetical protein U9P42_10315 [Candidatus Fermentibacteria bacterium]|nr:hypothetical protein [Candidatus Fermentibacteria bacterium]
MITRYYSMKYALLPAILLILFSGCMQDLGKLIEFNGGQLYYTTSVTAEEADRLGEFLIESGFYDGERKTVQLTKPGEVYEFRMAVREGVELDQNYVGSAVFFVYDLSENVFEGNPVAIHFCDTRMNTLLEISHMDFNPGGINYTSTVSSEEANALGEYLSQNGFFDEKDITVLLSKAGAVFEFRMVVLDGTEENPENLIILRTFAEEMSENVFNNRQLDFHLCDDQLGTIQVIEIR